MQKIAGGWQFNAIATFPEGQPFTLFSEYGSSSTQFGSGSSGHHWAHRKNIIRAHPYSFSTDCFGSNSKQSLFWIDSTEWLLLAILVELPQPAPSMAMSPRRSAIHFWGSGAQFDSRSRDQQLGHLRDEDNKSGNINQLSFAPNSSTLSTILSSLNPVMTAAVLLSGRF